MKFGTVLALTGVSASSSSLRTNIESVLQAGAGGPVNCAYKCGLMWNQRMTWNTNSGGGFFLYEYAACIEGCMKCDGGVNKVCQTQCKQENWPSYAYTFNKAKKLKKFDNNNLESKKTLITCLNTCETSSSTKPGEGAGQDGNLPRKFKKCTKKCYDENLPTVQAQSLTACQAGASATECGPNDSDCYTASDCFFGLRKGVVEADKACIQGCSQNLCQDGAACQGKGYWSLNVPEDKRGCALITSQTTGVRDTINPGYYGQASDLGDCCNAAMQRCGYSPGLGTESFGVSLGHVIATDKTGCLYEEQGVEKVYPAIQSKSPYECDCDFFFDDCVPLLGEGTVNENFICYGKGGPRTA